MSQDKIFYNMQNKTIESIKVTLEHYELRTIISELAIKQIEEAINELNESVANVVKTNKEI